METQQVAKKICLLGDPAVGKTSLIRKYVFGMFDDDYMATIGANVKMKTNRVEIPGANIAVDLKLLIWDIAGHKFSNDIHRSYYNGVEGALVVADITRRDTFDSVEEWGREVVKAAHPKAVDVLVLVNKFDLQDEIAVTQKDVDDFARKLDVSYLFTSAKDGTNVENAFSALSESLARRSLEPTDS